MTTVEKLFVQIFERKNSIIQKVKQQTDLYSQHLASKLLIDGISPPPWLWNPNQSSYVQKELNKEELISELLLPRPLPAVRFSQYNKPVVAGDNGELLIGLSKDIYSYNRGDIEDGQAITASYHDNNTRCTVNSVPEQDHSVNSPQDETEAKISNIYSAPDQSLARIQRSRSRQKALEIRCSGKAEAKNRRSQKNVSVGSSARNRCSIFGSEEDNKVNDSQELEPFVIRYGSCGVGESNKGDNRNKGKTVDCFTGKSTRLKISAEEASSGVGSLKLDRCSDSIQKNDSTLVQYEEEFSKYAVRVNELPEAISTSDVTADICGEARVEDCWVEEKGTDTCDGKIEQPSSSQQLCCLNEGPEVEISIHSAKADCGTFGHSMQQFDNANHAEETTKPPEGLALERARSKTTSNDEVLPTVSYTSSLAGGHRDNTAYSSEVHRTSSSEAIMPCPDTCNISHQQRNVDAVNTNELISHDLVKDRLVNSRSNINHDGSECLVSKPSSECLIFLEPKQLDFDDSEQCNSAEHFIPKLENRRLEKSPKEAFGTPSDLQITFDGFNDTMPQKLPSAEPGISIEAEEFCRDSFESTCEEHFNIQVKEYSSHTNEHPILEITQEDSKVVLHVQNSNFEHQTDITHSNAFQSSHTEEPFSPKLENRRLEKSPKEAFGTPSDLQITSDGFNDTMPQKLQSAEPGISTKAEEFRRDFFESTCEENFNVQLKEYSSHTSERLILETMQEDAEIVLHVQNSDFEHQTDITHSNAFESSHTEDHVNCYCKEVCKSPPEPQTDEGQYRTEGKAKSTPASNASKRKHLARDSKMWENDFVTCGLFEFPLGNYQHDLSKSEELKFGKMSQPFKMGSWPRTKRRKIEDQESDSCSDPPSHSVQMDYCSQPDDESINLEKVGGDVETVLEYASPMNGSSNEEMKQKVCELNEEMKPLTDLQNGEGALSSGMSNEHLGSSSPLNFQQVAVPIFSTLAKEVARVSQECLVEELDMPADLEKDNDEQDMIQGNMVSTEGLTCSDRTILEGKSYPAVDGKLSHYLEEPPYKTDMELIGFDQSLPELEGFIINSQTENEVEISGDQINFDGLDLPRTSIERASILEQICKSASQQAISTQFSSSFKLHGSHKSYQSVPNGLLECGDLTGISDLSKDIDKQVWSNCMDDVNGCLEVLSCSNSLRYSGSQFGWDSHNPYSSPVGKLWEKMSLHTGSSGKALSSNPELTCFPIEEDPSVSEENENVYEVSDKIQEDIVSSINTSAKREPLADITEPCLNAPSPAAVVDKFLSKGSRNSVTKDASFSDTHSKAKKKVGNHSRDKSLGKENDILSFGEIGIKKSEASLNSRFSKVNSSCKTSSRRERKKLSEKEPKRNNIVSNVTSFIPLVQQKQAAAQCTGKREIKVKALETAEAAKRLEEKKANERKIRKEALKVERARLEKENLRQLELEKKRKEEERKKKDADIVAKKRQREEEGKKERERKRKRLEEARQQQREDGKLRSEKVEKAKQLSVIGENGKNKESNNEAKRSQVLLQESRDNIPLEKPESKLRSTSHVQDAGISIEACRASTDSGDHRKATSAFNKSPKTDMLAVKNIQGKSYEISPYQCSDDDEEEEEEEEEVPNKKFIPSWTSKSCLALAIPLQQGIDPDTIFPPDSFCSTDEVLRPRKPQHKQSVI